MRRLCFGGFPTPAGQVLPHCPGAGSTGNHPAIQLPFPDRMHFPALQWGSIEYFYLFYWRSQFRSDSLPENPFQRMSVRMHYLGKHFPLFREKAGIMHNTNSSGAARQVRELLGFTGFLVAQTFYSQVKNISKLRVICAS